MRSYSAYTPLEALLLFQGLRHNGVQPSSFNNISDQLKNISLVKNEPSFDSGRLSPDALRELYLDLLKEEVKVALEQQRDNAEGPVTNGNVSPGSRKRKAPSPSLPTVKEAARHSHLIPQLVTRLYTRYRNHVVQKLRANEAEYAEAERRQQEDVQADQLAKSQTQSARPSPKPSSSIQKTLDGTKSGNATPPGSVSFTKPYTQAQLDRMKSRGPDTQNGPDGNRQTSSSTALPPLSGMAPQSPRYGVPPNGPGPVPPQSAMPQAPPGGYTQSPPAGRQSPYPPQQAHPRAGSVHSPQAQQTFSRASSSPRPILPPPQGMPIAPVPHGGSPAMQGPMQHQPGPQQQYQHPAQQRMAQGQTQPGDVPSRAYSTTPLAPHPHGGYYQQQPLQPQYMDRRISHPMPQSSQGQPYPNQAPPHQGGYMLPPFQVPPPDPSKTPQQPRMPQLAQRPPGFPHNGPATAPRPQLPPRLVSDIVSALATPPRPKLRPLWKSFDQRTPLDTKQVPFPRPDIEPLSPTQSRAKSPSVPKRSTRGRHAPTTEEPLHAEPASKTTSRKRRANAREKSPHSVVSSAADELMRTRTRSHSVSTVAGNNTQGDERPGSRNGVKAEPSTPAADMLEEAEPTPTQSTTPASGIKTRKRRGTGQAQPPPPPKRKKQESPSAQREDTSTPPPRSNTIAATRNFAKVSAAVMEGITSHKHATYFAKEVREKDAPGYSDIVKQPQNLKSIRAAIAAGPRAIAAASTVADSPSATPSTSSTTIELERSVDLMPPKAIVNSAQLEKELMRMFANAYMFNPGYDGMALTTREMFQDVEQTISDWRNTDRREVAGDEEEEGKGKRRKV